MIATLSPGEMLGLGLACLAAFVVIAWRLTVWFQGGDLQ